MGVRELLRRHRVTVSRAAVALSALVAMWHAYILYRGVAIGEKRVEISSELPGAVIQECVVSGVSVPFVRRGERFVFTHRGDGHLVVSVAQGGRVDVVDCGYAGVSFDDFVVDRNLKCARSFKSFFRL